MIIPLGSEIDVWDNVVIGDSIKSGQILTLLKARTGGKCGSFNLLWSELVFPFDYKLMQSKSKQKRIVVVRKLNK